MSDYTPTTEEVHAVYAWATGIPANMLNAVPSLSEVQEKAKEAFDRWLAEHDREKKAEAWKEGFSDCLAFMALSNPDYERASKYFDRVSRDGENK